VQRTDIKGSGFIQFPPQKPFAQKLERQPPTLSVRAAVHHGEGASLLRSSSFLTL
jgi:hypothetical protein